MITEKDLLKMACQFDDCSIEDRGFSIGIKLIGKSRVKYGVSFTIEKSDINKLSKRVAKANNAVIQMLGDRVSIAA